MVKYYHKTAPEAIVIELYLIAKFGINHDEIDPREYPQLEVVCDAVAFALKGKTYGEAAFEVEFGVNPTINVQFKADYQIEEKLFDSKYGAGAVKKACEIARQNAIELEVQNKVRKGMVQK